MARPTVDVKGPEYLNLLKQRELYKKYKYFYPHMTRAIDALDRLEEKALLGFFTYQDHLSFERARTIINFVDKEMKEETRDTHTTTHYIWRTQGDGKVRSRHAVNNGKIFSWDKPPPTGHPGEDYGCRCWAEPHKAKFVREYSEQTLTGAASDTSRPWTLEDYYYHYKNENGRPVTLHEIGILGRIIRRSESIVYRRVEPIIFKKVQTKRAGNYPFRWNDSYDFDLVEPRIGGATVTLNATLSVKNMGYHYEIEGDLNYEFYDKFTDPFDFTNSFEGDYNLPDSTPFDITDAWSTRLKAVILNKSTI